MMPESSRHALVTRLYQLDRATRLYRSTLLEFPGVADRFGWDTLCDLSDRTAAQTRIVLERSETARGMDCDLDMPPPFITRDLDEKIRARRALLAPRPRRPGMDLH